MLNTAQHSADADAIYQNGGISDKSARAASTILGALLGTATGVVTHTGAHGIANGAAIGTMLGSRFGNEVIKEDSNVAKAFLPGVVGGTAASIAAAKLLKGRGRLALPFATVTGAVLSDRIFNHD